MKLMMCHSGENNHLQAMEDQMLEWMDVPEGCCDSVGRLWVSRLWADLWSHAERPPWRQELVTLGGTYTEAVCEELHLMGVTDIGGVFEVCLPWKGFHTEAGQECEESSSWGWRIGRDLMKWPQASFLIPLHHWGKAGREPGCEIEPRKKEWVGGKCFKICLYFSLCYTDLLDE